MTYVRKLASNTFYIFLQSSSLLFFSLLYWIVAGKLLLPEEYGIANTTIQFIGLLSTISLLGLTSAVSKLIPEYHGTKKHNRIYGVIRYTFKIILILNLVALISIFFLSPFLASVIFKDPNLFATFQIASVGVLLSSFSTFFYSIIYGFQKMRLVFISDFFSNLIKVIISISLILLGYSFFGPITGFVIALLVGSLIKLTGIKLKKANEIDVSKIWMYALPALIGTLCVILLNQTGAIILSSFSSVKAAGLFTTIKYSLLISIPIILVIVTFPHVAIRFLAKPEYLESINVLRLLSVSNLIFGIGSILLNVLYAVGKPSINRNILIVSSIVYLPLAVLLATSFSAIGITFAYLISFSLMLALAIFYVKKFYKFEFRLSYLTKTLISALITLIFLYAVGTIVDNIYELIIVAISSAFLYLVILFPLKFFDKQDLLLLEGLRKGMPKTIDRIIYFFENLIKRFL